MDDGEDESDEDDGEDNQPRENPAALDIHRPRARRLRAAAESAPEAGAVAVGAAAPPVAARRAHLEEAGVAGRRHIEESLDRGTFWRSRQKAQKINLIKRDFLICACF